MNLGKKKKVSVALASQQVCVKKEERAVRTTTTPHRFATLSSGLRIVTFYSVATKQTKQIECNLQEQQ